MEWLIGQSRALCKSSANQHENPPPAAVCQPVQYLESTQIDSVNYVLSLAFTHYVTSRKRNKRFEMTLPLLSRPSSTVNNNDMQEPLPRPWALGHDSLQQPAPHNLYCLNYHKHSVTHALTACAWYTASH